MSEDWFEFVQLANGMSFVQGSNAQGELIVLELGEGEVAAVEKMEARHNHAMQKLLRELATIKVLPTPPQGSTE